MTDPAELDELRPLEASTDPTDALVRRLIAAGEFDELVQARAAALQPVAPAEGGATFAYKPGVQTSEFWITILVIVGGALAAVYAETEWGKLAGIIVAGLKAQGYTHSRTKVKNDAIGPA